MHPSLPKYAQLIDIIKEAIRRHELLPEQRLPNEDELAVEYGMSRGTVRKAIAELQRMGLVRKEQGRGTFINGTKPTLTSFSLVEFDAYILAKNQQPSTETLVFETVVADETIASQLNLEAGSDVFHVVQLRLASGVPMIYEERYFAKSVCPDLHVDLLRQHSLHHILVETCQIPLIRMSHTIEIGTLPADKFDLFKVKEAVSIFQVDRLSYTKQDDEIVPVAWYQAMYRADDYHFQAQFHTSF